ncbi:MAG: hypothetical protein IPQ10_02310 [Saprospiraceae bacterium]|nr:hypothetical protein [Saprospiraceae bacterium]MBK7796706.1 hypothetical protein [Saprospiraceae bacterium]MBL0259904.1 hypothetical protein [Saprospiraceae bacterium]
MAQYLEVSLDWLTGQTDLELDRKKIQRIEEVFKMKLKYEVLVFAMLDAFLAKNKLQAILV